MNIRIAGVALALLLANGSVHASTLGLLRCTTDAASTIASTAKHASKSQAFVARDAASLAAAWKQGAFAGTAPAIDFTRQIAIGLVNSTTDDRVIYRVMLDNAAAATVLEVHVSGGDSPCGGDGRTVKAARAQLLVIPRSDLPVRFVVDTMIDGRMYVQDPAGEGVDTTELAKLPAGPPSDERAKAATREAAEVAVIAQLTAAEKASLAKGPLDRTLPRIPHGWTKLSVSLNKDVWTIGYDALVFHVDRATGKVTR